MNINRIAEYGVVPVVSFQTLDCALPLADALKQGGLPHVEIMLRTPCALDAIRTIKRERPEMTVGAGTVIRMEQAEAAIDAGADFIVTPGFNPKIVRHCIDHGMPIVPGCITPSEVEIGMDMGLNVFKYFPAETMGSLRNIEELAGPYPQARFLPTSGLGFRNMATYLRSRSIFAIGSNEMATPDMIENREWDKITALCQECVRLSLGFSLRKICFEAADACRNESILSTLAQLSEMLGGAIEFSGSGTMQLEIGASSLLRTRAYLERLGISCVEEENSLKVDGDNYQLRFVCGV